MICSFNRVDEFNVFFDLVSNSCETIELNFNPEGVIANVLNKSHVCFYNLKINEYFFIDYNVKENISLLIDCNEFHAIIKQLKNYNTIVLNKEENILEIIGLKEDNRIRFTLHLIDDNYSSPVPPAIDYTANCEIPLSDLKNASEIIEKVCKTDRFKVICSETKGFEISSPVDAMTGYNQTIHANITGDGEIVVNNSYISELNKLSKLNKNIEFKLGDGNIPLGWSISNEVEDIIINGLIAPILEEE